MIEIKDKKKCCGCGACFNICPKNAIKMISDKEGFLYPKVDTEKCIKCGLCKKVCPILNDNRNNNFYNPKQYAAWSNDDKNRLSSSSGGLFYELANFILTNNGVVFGAGFDNELNVIHKVANNVEDLFELKCSKYVQSNLNDCYLNVKEMLSSEYKVLFVGTPCQVAGLYSFLRNKEYKNLYTIDFVCHGVPSPKVYRKHLSELESKFNCKAQHVYFRDKSNGWKKFNFKVEFENNKIYKKNLCEDLFIRGFLKNMYLRPSCHECKFSKIPRVSDITLGDFWGINSISNKLDDDKGTSQVLINSDKGKYLFDSVFSNIFISEVDLEFGKKVNPCLISSVNPDKNRDKFFKDLDKNDMKTLEKKYFPKPNFIKKSLIKFKSFIRIIIPSSLKKKIKRIINNS